MMAFRQFQNLFIGEKPSVKAKLYVWRNNRDELNTEFAYAWL